MTATHPPAQAGATPFGIGADGEPATLVTLVAPGGIRAQVSDHGATLVSLWLPDRDGRLADVLLGCDDAEGYRAAEAAYLGAVVGRVANRTAGASFDLDGEQHTLAANEPPHHLHGGQDRALSRVRWRLVSVAEDAVVLRYRSPDGEEGYPGNLEVTVGYHLDVDGLTIRYHATTDRPTPVNLTNHAYVNLAGDGTIHDHVLSVAADHTVGVDAELIPTGEVVPVAGTRRDLRAPTRLGDRIVPGEPGGLASRGFDDPYLLRDAGGAVRRVATLTDPGSGRRLEVHTDQPCLQVYTGDQLADVAGKAGRRYGPHAGLCLEAQQPPDALHRPEWPSIVLRPGNAYRQETWLHWGVPPR